MLCKIFPVWNDACTSTPEILPIRQLKSYRPRPIYRKWISIPIYACKYVWLPYRNYATMRRYLASYLLIISGYSIWSRRQRASGGILLEMPVEDIDFDLFSIRDQHRNRLSLHKTSWNKTTECSRCAEAIAVCAIPLDSYRRQFVYSNHFV